MLFKPNKTRQVFSDILNILEDYGEEVACDTLKLWKILIDLSKPIKQYLLRDEMEISINISMQNKEIIYKFGYFQITKHL